MELNKIGLEDKKILAIVPHQDDELIGMGGFLAYACKNSAEVNVVLVTDGAADEGFLSVQGIGPCMKWSEILPDITPAVQMHDEKLLSSEPGRSYHNKVPDMIFEMLPDPERAAGISCPAWGKQRDMEFLYVCEALGLKREQIRFAFWDIDSPEHIKDGQISHRGEALLSKLMVSRYLRIAEYYIAQFQPDIVLTVVPYEFQPPPNDHWAIAHAVLEAAKKSSISQVYFHGSGSLYRHIFGGGAQPEKTLAVILPDEIWEIKKQAIKGYFQWDPARSLFATAAHSIPQTFHAILQSPEHFEYIRSDLDI